MDEDNDRIVELTNWIKRSRQRRGMARGYQPGELPSALREIGWEQSERFLFQCLMNLGPTPERDAIDVALGYSPDFRQENVIARREAYAESLGVSVRTVERREELGALFLARSIDRMVLDPDFPGLRWEVEEAMSRYLLAARWAGFKFEDEFYESLHLVLDVILQASKAYKRTGQVVKPTYTFGTDQP